MGKTDTPRKTPPGGVDPAKRQDTDGRAPGAYGGAEGQGEEFQKGGPHQPAAKIGTGPRGGRPVDYEEYEKEADDGPA